MKKSIKKTIYVILAALLVSVLSACSLTSIGTETGTGSTSGNNVTSGESVTPVSKKDDTAAEVLDDPANDDRESTSDFTLTPSDGAKAPEISGTVYTITGAGEYTASGKLEEGRIVIAAGENDEVTLILNDASISCSTGSAILASSASKVTVTAADGTYNVITDARTGDPDAMASEDDETNDDAAIYACCDLTVGGTGTLIVNGSYDNGIKTKDDLTVKKLSLKVTAKGNALKGSDSVTIKSGKLILISTGSDGIKTGNSSVSAKGNQKGTVSIEGGQIDVYAACDGISAAYNVDVSQSDVETVLNIFTSDYSGSEGAAASSDIYLILSASAYSKNRDYYAYFYSDSGEGTYVKLTYDTMVRSGRTSYYGLIGKSSSAYSKVMFLEVSSGADPAAAEPVKKSSGDSVNSSMNAWLVTGSSSLDGEWVRLSKDTSNSGKTAYSSKGIKAENAVNISGGTVTIKCMDDGIHANADGTLENGAKAVGAINITGGSVTITAADDGMHADGELTISGGYVNVEEAYEGLEANIVTIAGGSTYIYGKDDGINACKGSASTPMIYVTGGYLEVRTPSGDTDAIDSNGSFEMTGGVALIMGGSSSGMMAGSVDVDRNLTVTGGTIIAFGGICETPGSGSVNTYVGSGSFSAGEYVLAEKNGEEILKFTVTGSYSSVWISSGSISLNKDYVLTKDGSNVLSWTQTAQSVGSSGSGGFNPGGWPGRR
ncbi:MAG: carbohydrate-binding domain-containing protein [Clostridia bacterium]|nr:carbohydrate-binding domain-containing protein [Clostridia bacterium]